MFSLEAGMNFSLPVIPQALNIEEEMQVSEYLESFQHDESYQTVTGAQDEKQSSEKMYIMTKHLQFYFFIHFLCSFIFTTMLMKNITMLTYALLHTEYRAKKKEVCHVRTPGGVCVYAFACFCAFMCDTMWVSELLF